MLEESKNNLIFSKEVPTKSGQYLIKYKDHRYAVAKFTQGDLYFKTVEPMHAQIVYVDCLSVEWLYIDEFPVKNICNKSDLIEGDCVTQISDSVGGI